MKELTNDEFLEAPVEIQVFYTYVRYKFLVPINMYEKLKIKHPKYFVL